MVRGTFQVSGHGATSDTENGHATPSIYRAMRVDLFLKKRAVFRGWNCSFRGGFSCKGAMGAERCVLGRGERGEKRRCRAASSLKGRVEASFGCMRLDCACYACWNGALSRPSAVIRINGDLTLGQDSQDLQDSERL